LQHIIRVKKKGTDAMSGKPGRSGRKSFVATPEQRNNVKILVGLGVPQAMICQLVMNPQTGKPLDISVSRSPSALPNCGARTSPAARNVNSAIPVPRRSTTTIRSRRLRVRCPKPDYYTNLGHF
jgi:hypothetical protein